MIHARLDEMFKGWFIGNFEPSLIKTGEVEVAVKVYQKGEFEQRHYHRLATEITVVSTGRVRMNNNIYEKGDIVVVQPLESTDFEALEDSITTVVKYPGVSNDKYEGVPQ